MIYAFAGCALDTRRHSLTRDGEDVHVEPQVFDLLRLLAENAGELVSKDRLIDEIWQGRIVSEATISARINACRAAVGDTGKEQQVIRTVPRRGFTMVADVTRGDAGAGEVSETLTQTVRYTTSRDGAHIAWSEVGEGPPVLFAWHHLSNLEKDWVSPLLRPAFTRLARHHRLVRFDVRGSGLSDPLKPADGFEKHVEDMAAVADAAGLETFAIIGVLQAAAVAIRFAATHPERVSHLVIQNGYARGRSLRETAPPDPESDPFISLLRSGGWGDPENGFMRAWATMVQPMATADETTELIRLIAHAGSTEDALLQRDIIDRLDVRADLGRVFAPTLVLHARLCAIHPATEGRRVAAGIAGSEFKELDSSNTFFSSSDPEFDRVMQQTIDFLAR